MVCMCSRIVVALFAMFSCVSAGSSRPIRRYTKYQPSLEEIQREAAVAKTNSWTSSVGGKAFDRFFVIWLENTDYDKAAGDMDMVWLSEQGITLTNYWALTHPSQPNYLASVGGDYFALDDDRFIRVPSNVSSIVDLLDTKDISWGEYQEGMPHSGFQGYNFSNQETFENNYVRKHNPLVLFDSVTEDENRLANLKNFTQFYKDLEAGTLPQYGIITPNMTNDGHDTTIRFAARWTRSFLQPLIRNEEFMKNTLVLLTFDENDHYPLPNRVFSVLLGGAVPEHLKGTTDDTFYEHYSQISSIEANWDLPSLGRHDVDANVFSFVADATGIKNKEVETTFKYNNHTYIGYFNDDSIEFPAPNVSAINRNGRGVLDSIKSVWSEKYEEQVKHSYFTSTTTTPGQEATGAPIMLGAGNYQLSLGTNGSTAISASSISNTVSTSATSVSQYKGGVKSTYFTASYWHFLLALLFSALV